MALRIDSSQNRNLYVGTSTQVAVDDGNAIVTGKVGIGVTSPQTKLDVAGNATVGSGLGAVDTDGILTINGGSGGGGEAYLNLTRGGTSGFILNHAIGNIQVRATANIPMYFWTNDLIRQTIAADGNVGIGTTSPNTYSSQTTLTINGSTYGRIDLESGGTLRSSLFSQAANTSLTVSTGFFSLDTGGSERIRIDSAGNVGINTTTPQVRLEVKSSAHSQFAAHFGQGQNNSAGVFGGISLGYTEANTAYRKVAIVAQALGDGAARQNLHFLVDTANDGGSAQLADTKMMIDGLTGFVGIGTTSPSTLLDVEKNQNTLTAIKVKNTDTGTGSRADLIAESSSSSMRVVATSSGYTGVSGWSDAGIISTDSGTSGGLIFNAQTAHLSFQTATNERMRITSAGNVGIGTTTMNQFVNITSGSNATTLMQLRTADNSEIMNFGIGSDVGYLYMESNTAMTFGTNGGERMRIDSAGNVGIGLTAPQSALHVKKDQGLNNAITRLRGQNLTSRETKLQFEDYSGLLADAFISFVLPTAASATDAYLGLGVNNTSTLVVHNNDNVGIGMTNPQSKLQIKANQHAADPGGKDYTGSAINADGGDIATGKLFLQGFQKTANDLCGFNNEADRVVLYNYTDARYLQIWNHTGDTIIPNGNLGIGITVPVYKLDVNGGAQAGGKVTYTKSAGSLDTTGYAVAGITALPNGNGFSCGFTFTCFGGAGKYQKLVYSCYNSVGTWNAKKVIDEGTNDLDVAASANGSTITFTFKARSSSQSFTPRVTVEAAGIGINSTYA